LIATVLLSLIALLVLASWVFWLVACCLVRSFFRTRQQPDPQFTPPVSILKPARGLDAEIYKNFSSFCGQDYPEYELIFGVADPDDPVIEVVERLKREHPEERICLLVTPANRVNRKAALLHALSARARYDTLVVSDSDMRVTSDYLRRVVAPLVDPQVGLVNCLYRGLKPLTLTARLEALYMNATFLPSVLVARKVLKGRFAMGATVVLRKHDLARIGGFAAVADYLADDYQLGMQIAKLGLRVHMSDYIVSSVLGPTTFLEQWDREVRWAHCNRVSRPLEYPGLLITFSTPLAFLLVIATGFDDWLGWLALMGSLLVRWLVAWQVTGYTQSQHLRRWLLWLPVRDMLSSLIWLAGGVGRHVVWRGEQYVLQADGRLASPRPVSQRLVEEGCPGLLKGLIRAVDATLRRVEHIHEFTPDPTCMIRVSIAKSKEEIRLGDGTVVRKGDPIGLLHFWNERIPQIPPGGPDLGWALAFQRRTLYSLRLLAAYVRDNPEFDGVQAFGSPISFGAPYDFSHGLVLAERWGFDGFIQDGAGGWLRRFGLFWENLYAFSLIWAYNPDSVEEGRLWRMRRDELWMSRGTLLSKYGTSTRRVIRADIREDRPAEVISWSADC
jgi:ceramide glucosyltransferase